MGLQRREFLSLVGAGAVSSVVLSACGKLGGGTKVKGPTIGMLQMVDAPPPNNTRKGFEAALAEAGYIPGKTVNFIQKDAAGELPNTTLVMKQFVGDKVDMVLAVGTPPLQAAMKVAPATTPVIFCYCSNPWGAGAGTPPGGVGQHKPNVVGTIGTKPGQRLGTPSITNSDQLKITERIYLDAANKDLLHLDFTYEDPNVLSQPWHQNHTFRRDRTWDILEYVCAENNRHPLDENGQTQADF